MASKMRCSTVTYLEDIREDLGLIPPNGYQKGLLSEDKSLYNDRKKLFGRYLKLKRELTFESVEGLAEYTGIPARVIKAYESGKDMPDELTVRKLSEVLLNDEGLLYNF